MFTYEVIQSFNELEMSIYNFIVQNKQKVIYMKIRELSEAAHVSTTTVLRFCKKVGCSGYSEFKLKLKMYLQNELVKPPELDISVLRDFLNRAEMEAYQTAINKAVEILKQATAIIFIGTGSSGMIGKYGARYFNNVGYLSLCIDDPFTPVLRGGNKSLVVIALSVSGTTKETLQLADQLKRQNCPLISITNSANSTLAQMSDCNISYYIPQMRVQDEWDITSQIPVLFTLETLGRRLK